MRRAIALVAVLLLAASVGHAEEKKHAWDDQLSAAIGDFNNGRLKEAAAAVEKILAEHPDAYDAYSVYWKALGRLKDADTVRKVVEAHLATLAGVPPERRDEDYYSTVVQANGMLDRDAEVERITSEAVSRFPRGDLAQLRMIDRARSETDPVKAAALYDEYIKAFPEHTSWVNSAAGDRFYLMARNPDRFPPDAVLKAAETFEATTLKFVEVFGNPYRYPSDMARIATSLAAKDPRAALDVARRGLRYVDEHWMESEDFGDEARMWFYPVLLEGSVGVEDWPAAVKAGRPLFRDVDAASAPWSLGGEKGEPRFRALYARALEGEGDLDGARLQFAWAAKLDASRAPDAAAFSARHPLAEADAARFERLLADQVAAVAARKDEVQKLAVLAKQTKAPASPFTLKDVDGRAVSLADLSGKVVVVAFWASWCGPCVRELEDWKTAHETYKADPDVALLAVSTDTDKDAAIKAARDRGYKFRVLLTDGSVEAPYGLQSIPQLYVIDRRGNVRFHHTGYEADGYYLKRLAWMIDASR